MASVDTHRILNIKRKENPVKSYLWYLELPTDINGFDSGDVFGLNSRIISVNTPFNTYETAKQETGNTFWYYSTSSDIGTITFEIVEHEDGLTRKYLESWEKMISNTNGTFNPPIRYKRNLNFFRLDAMKQKITIDKYSGYFISNIADITNEYESNGLVKYTVTLTGDSVQHINEKTKEFELEKDDSILGQVANAVVGAKEFIDNIKNARISKKSITEILF